MISKLRERMMICKRALKKHRLHLLLLAVSLSPAVPAFAYNLKQALTHGEAELQLGGYWNTQGHAQHIDIAEIIGDDFSAPAPKSPGSGLVGVGYFIEGVDSTSFHTTYGLNWFFLGPTNRSGTVTQENLYTNLSYQYKVTNYPLYAVIQSSFPTSSPKYGITVNAGIGPNFMVTSQFSEQSLGNNTLPDHIFAGTTTTVLSATAGVGFKINHFFGTSPLECGYRFFYLGQGKFKTLSDQVYTDLNTGQGYANAVMCTFRK